MSDVGGADAMEHVPQSASTDGMTAGAMMRSAREAAGLHVAALAVSMKIPVKKLEALEADRLDLLHDAVFVRALAASVCRALKIDPAPILNKLPLNGAPKLNTDERGINAPFHSPSDAAGMSLTEWLVKPTTLFVAALFVAAAVVYFMPDMKAASVSVEAVMPSARQQDVQSASQGSQTMASSLEASPEPVAASAPMVNPSAESAVQTVATAAPAIAQAPSQKASAPVAVPQPVVAASRPVVVASAAAPAVSRPASAPALPKTGTVVFKAKGTTWVKVVDAKGIVQLSKTLSEGEVVGASGAAPLSVVIGRVDATEVEVRGQAFSLTAVSKDNVARFEVK